ncbi:MAG: aldo/keto reductase [Candidatus Latescibacterota bacterium]
MARQSVVDIAPLPQRQFGKTGETVPILGLGSAPGGMGLPDVEAIELYHAALDLGVTYLDTAPGYDKAQVQLGQVMNKRRDEAFLVTKTFASEGKKATEILEQSLCDLQTDQVDLAFVHSVSSLDVDQVLAPDGALAALRNAQKRGLVRFVGITCHARPWKAVKILKAENVDAVMFAMNYVDRHTYNFQGEALALAVAQEAGIAAMKVYGGAPGMKYDGPTPSMLGMAHPDRLETALHYALGLKGVGTAVVGMFSIAELEQNIAWARNYQPLSANQLAVIDREGQDLAKEWGEHFGPLAGDE